MKGQKGLRIFIVFVLLCFLLFLCLKEVDHPSLIKLEYKEYISLLSSLASFFVALVFILEYCHIQKSDKDLKKYTFADDARDYWHQMEVRFQDPELYALYAELNSNHPYLKTYAEKENSQKMKEVQTVSLLLSQIENILILHGEIDSSINPKLSLRQEQQIRVWKRFFTSPTVLYHYQYLKENIGRDTQLFIQRYLLS